jgi:hypothetical protein
MIEQMRLAKERTEQLCSVLLTRYIFTAVPNTLNKASQRTATCPWLYSFDPI